MRQFISGSGVFNSKKLSSIAHDTEQLYDFIHSYCLDSVRSIVCSLGGNNDDALDMMHDTFLVAKKKCSQLPLNSTCELKAYLLGICRNLWFKEIGRRNITEKFVDDKIIDRDPEEENLDEVRLQREKLFWKYFKSLGHECRRIIHGVLKREEKERMAYLLGCQRDTLYRKKSNCIKVLLKCIKCDPMYKQLKSE